MRDEPRHPRRIGINEDETSHSSDAPGDAPPPTPATPGGIFAALKARLARALAQNREEQS